MSRLFGFVINDAQRVACALYPAREALVAESAPEGWGLASYQGGEVLLQRHPKPVAGPLDLYRFAREQRTDYLVGQVRDASTPAKLENTQPYRFRSWVFARSGAVQPGGAEVLEKVPDFLRRNIRGQDPAEGVFHLFLSFLHDSGRLDDPNIKMADAAAALASTLAIAEQKAGGVSAPANLVTTNGRILLAVRAGRPMWTRRVNGIADCPVCAEKAHEPARGDRRRISHEHVRAVLLVSDPAKTADLAMEEIPDRSIVGISRDLEQTVRPLSPL